MRRTLINLGIVAVVSFGAGWYVNGLRKDATIADLNDEYQQAIIRTTEAMRQKERDRVTLVEKQKDDAIQKLEGVEADLVASRSAAGRLQRELGKLRDRAACPDPAIAVGGEGYAGHDPVGLLINMLTGVDAAGRELAEYADRLRIAGQTCEQVYDEIRQDRR